MAIQLPGFPASKPSLPVLRLTSKSTYLTAFCILFVLGSIYVWLTTDSSSSLRSGLKESLLEKLVYSNPPPVGAKVDVMYVLGGAPKSLELKYQTAAALFKKGISQKIWM